MNPRRVGAVVGLVLGTLSGLLMPAPAGAVEWSAEPYVSLKTLYNDNFTLTTDPHKDVWGVILAPGLKLNGESEVWKVTGEAQLRSNHYSEHEFNTTEGVLAVRSQYRAERNTLGLNAQFIRDNTLLGELATTGVAQAFTPRTELTINPSWSRSLSEQTKLVATYDFTDVNYSNTTATTLIDYRDQLATIGLEHNLTERTTTTLTAYYNLFQTDPSNFEARTVGILGGIAHDFSETLRASVVGGPRTTRSTTSSQTQVCTGPINNSQCSTGTFTTLSSDVTKDTTAFTLTADLNKRWTEIGSVNLRLARELNPTGIGALVQTDLLRVSLTRELSPTVTALLDAGVYRSKYVGAAIDQNKARYLRVEPHVSWRVSPQWTIDAGYVHAREKYDAQSSAATANVAYVTFTYTWQKMAVSR